LSGKQDEVASEEDTRKVERLVGPQEPSRGITGRGCGIGLGVAETEGVLATPGCFLIRHA